MTPGEIIPSDGQITLNEFCAQNGSSVAFAQIVVDNRAVPLIL